MGNQTANAISVQQVNRAKTTPNQEDSLSKLMGPWKLSFPKLLPKECAT